MQQVGKFLYNNKIFLISIIMMTSFTGCSYKNQKPLVSTQTYTKEISQDQLLDAAKKVFILSDKEKFIIDAYRNKVHVTKPRISFSMIDPRPQSDYFDFVVEKDKKSDALIATLAISRENILEENSLTYIDPNSASHKLFWERIDFLLGLNERWTKCYYIIEHNFLCNTIELEDQNATKEDIIQTEDSLKKNEYHPKVIDLGDIMYKNRSNTVNSVPENEKKLLPAFKDEKKGIREDVQRVRSFNFKDIEVKDRKPSKKVKSLDEEKTTQPEQ